MGSQLWLCNRGVKVSTLPNRFEVPAANHSRHHTHCHLYKVFKFRYAGMAGMAAPFGYLCVHICAGKTLF
ncbi:hypothetical protein EMPG_17313 [Blastomyces silverae]|uniref:Uncharacterized protein n=1 Tax=Blastomyces silverae TaxID=2060906 RepID=A0A0H1B6W4_9EURO|nr:hypothetical protein EMPG_17313 [Blastomyces silverae]